MKTTSLNKWFVLAIAAACFAGSTGAAIAGRANQITHFYYVDDTHTGGTVGEMTYLCGSGTYQIGEPSPYYVTVTVPCQDGAPVANPNAALPTEFHNCKLKENDAFHGFTCWG